MTNKFPARKLQHITRYNFNVSGNHSFTKDAVMKWLIFNGKSSNEMTDFTRKHSNEMPEILILGTKLQLGITIFDIILTLTGNFNVSFNS